MDERDYVILTLVFSLYCQIFNLQRELLHRYFILVASNDRSAFDIAADVDVGHITASFLALTFAFNRAQNLPDINRDKLASIFNTASLIAFALQHK